MQVAINCILYTYVDAGLYSREALATSIL